MESHHLGLIRTLCEKGAKEGVKRAAYPEVLRFQQDQAKARLQCWLLFSPLEEVYALAKMPEFASLKTALPELIKTLSYCVRFPRPRYRTEVNQEWANTKTYVQDTWDYAEKNRQLVEKLLPNLSKITWKELLDKITEDRVNRGKLDPKKQALYRTRKTDTQITVTQSTWIFEVSQDLQTTPASCRYSTSAALLRDYVRENQISLFSPKQSSTMQVISSESEKSDINYGLSYKVHYPIPGTQETVPLTTISFGALVAGGPYKLAWRHPTVNAIRKLEGHQEGLYRRLVNKEGDHKVRSYWLASTLCEIERGTPHIALIWLNLIHRHLQLPPPIPKLPYFFLDNAMLMLPVEEAIKKWDTFLEPIGEP